MTKNLMYMLFIVRWATRHLSLHCLHGYDFDAKVDFTFHVPGCMLDEYIELDKRIFSELNLNSYTLFFKITFVRTWNCF